MRPSITAIERGRSLSVGDQTYSRPTITRLATTTAFRIDSKSRRPT
jgi:hypothetical protein